MIAAARLTRLTPRSSRCCRRNFSIEPLRAAGFELGAHVEPLAALVALRLAAGDAACAGGGEARPEWHPLFVPLTRSAAGAVLGVVAMPPGVCVREMALPVVTLEPGAPQGCAAAGSGLTLLARSAEAYVARAALEGEAGADAEAAAEAGAEAGAAAAHARRVKVLTGAGMDPETMRHHAVGFLRKGEELSALIAAERSADCHRGWAAGHWWQVSLLRKLGRAGEAHDMAFAMLASCPLWTLPSAAELASYPQEAAPDVAAAGRGLLEDVAWSARVEGGAAGLRLRAEDEYAKLHELALSKNEMTAADVARERALALMDAVAAGGVWDGATEREGKEGMVVGFAATGAGAEAGAGAGDDDVGYAAVRPRLAELLGEAELPVFAKLVE